MQAQPQQLVAVRIKDGLFVGNQTSSQDDEFLFMNKVSHIVNCAGSESPNLFQQANVHYLTYHWRDLPNTTLFDAEGRNIRQIFEFIEKGLDKGECVLVHSVLGISRCCAIVAAYLMAKYGWTLDNTVAFMRTAHPDMDIKPYFLRQLGQLARKMEPEYDIFHPEVDTDAFCLDNEQWMLRNTYINSLGFDHVQNGETRRAVIDFEEQERAAAASKPLQARKRITFSDTGQGTSYTSAVTKPIIAGRAPADPNEKLRLFPATRGILAKAPLPLHHPLQSADGRQCTIERWPLRTHRAPVSAAPAPVNPSSYQHQPPAAPTVPALPTSTAAPQQPPHPLPTLRSIDGPASMQAVPTYSANASYQAPTRYDSAPVAPATTARPEPSAYERYSALGAGLTLQSYQSQSQAPSQGHTSQAQAQSHLPAHHPHSSSIADDVQDRSYTQPREPERPERQANPSPVSMDAAPAATPAWGAGAGSGAGGASQLAVNPALLRQPRSHEDPAPDAHHAANVSNGALSGYGRDTMYQSGAPAPTRGMQPAAHHHATSGASATAAAPGPSALDAMHTPAAVYSMNSVTSMSSAVEPPRERERDRERAPVGGEDRRARDEPFRTGALRLHQPPSAARDRDPPRGAAVGPKPPANPPSSTNSPRGAGPTAGRQSPSSFDSLPQNTPTGRGGYSAGSGGGLASSGNSPGLRGRTQGHSPFSVHSQGPRKGSPLPLRTDGRDRAQPAHSRYGYDSQPAAQSNVAFGSSVGLSPRDHNGLGPAVNRIQARHGVRGGTPTKQRAGSPSQRTSVTGSPQRVNTRKTYSSLHFGGPGRAGTPTRERERPGTPTGEYEGRPTQRMSRAPTRDSSLQKSNSGDWSDARPYSARSGSRDPYSNQPDSARSMSEDQRARKGLGPKRGLAQNTGAASPLAASIKKPLRASSASDRLMQPTVSFLRKTSRN